MVFRDVTADGSTRLTGGSVADLIYPIGSIYISVNASNPSTFFGGTWVAFGQGKTLVGINPAETEFDTVEETGGEKTHLLTIDEIPSHNHGGATGGQSANHTHTLAVRYSANFATSGTAPGIRDVGGVSGGGGSSANAVTNGASVGHTHAIPAQGGGDPHNNLQPYIVTYMWKRTA